MNASNANSSEEPDVVAGMFKQLRERLEDGGPEVSQPLVLAYIEGQLEAKDRHTVQHLIDRYRNWNDAYWELRHIVDMADVRLDFEEELAQVPPANLAVNRDAHYHRCDRSTRDELPLSDTGLERVEPVVINNLPRKGISRRLYPLFVLAATVLVAVGLFAWRNWHGREPQVVAMLSDAGGLVTIDHSGNLSGLESYPDQWKDRAKTLLTETHFDVSSAVAGLTSDVREKGTRSGDNPYAALVSPVNTQVDTDRPTLKWRPPQGGADSYQVVVYDAKGAEVKRETVTVTEWQVPESMLQRGEIYSWRIVAFKGVEQRPAPAEGIPAPKFVVLDESSLERIRLMERELAGSHLLLSLLYADAGMLDAAERELRLLVGSNPDAEILQALLRSLDRQRRGGM